MSEEDIPIAKISGVISLSGDASAHWSASSPPQDFMETLRTTAHHRLLFLVPMETRSAAGRVAPLRLLPAIRLHRAQPGVWEAHKEQVCWAEAEVSIPSWHGAHTPSEAETCLTAGGWVSSFPPEWHLGRKHASWHLPEPPTIFRFHKVTGIIGYSFSSV